MQAQATSTGGGGVERLALLTTLATFGLLIVGGLVHATGSGLACPEAWFICHGSLFPRMVGQVLYEHGHRLFAMTVGLLTVATMVQAWRRRKDDRHLRYATLGAFWLIWVQGSLGALTVKLKLPWYVSSAHLAVSMLFFSLLVYLSLRSLPETGAEPLAIPPSVRRLLAVTTITVYVQIVLGALVRHHGAGLACNTQLPWCNGGLWSSSGPAQLHLIHRYFALVVAAHAIAATFRVRAALRADRRAPRLIHALAVAPAVLALAQIGLGLLSVVTFLGIAPVTLHLGAGALLLASVWALYLSTGPVGARLLRSPS